MTIPALSRPHANNKELGPQKGWKSYAPFLGGSLSVFFAEDLKFLKTLTRASVL